MAFTKDQAEAAFDHVLDNVLEMGNDSPLKNALIAAGITDIYFLRTADDDMLNSLRHKDAKVPKPICQLVKLFNKFVDYLIKCGEPVKHDWLSLTAEEFNMFRFNSTYRDTVDGSLPSTAFQMFTSSGTMASGTTTSSGTTDYSPAVVEFKHGIKRDPTFFPSLKNEKYNDVWHRSFASQARAQDVGEVLDPEYIPSTVYEKELFDQKQKYVYSVLDSKVLTDRGRAIVRKYESTWNAQEAYNELTKHHLSSTRARIDSSAVLVYITSSRIDDEEWKGKTGSFILKWIDQVRLYERYVPLSDRFSEGQKLVILQNAVAPNVQLRQVKTMVDLEKLKTGKSIEFDDYVTLLLSAATLYDEQYKSKNAAPTELSPKSVISINAQVHQDNRQRPFIAAPGSKHAFTQEQWDQLSDEDKWNAIL